MLARVLPASGLVLEIASGTGQHAVHMARALPRLTWQPSDPDPEMRASIRAWTARSGLANVRAPLDLDVRAACWPLAAADAVVCINLIHIAPWSATAALAAGAARLLPPAGVLVLYGPFRREGRHTAPSNAAFDRSLRAADPDWGVRDLESAADVASAAGSPWRRSWRCRPTTSQSCSGARRAGEGRVVGPGTINPRGGAA